MVMKRSMMAKNLRQSIFRSLGRFIAIAVIIALGAAIFVGLRTTKADMVATGQKYMDAQNMFDLRLLTSYGWSKDQVEQVAQLEAQREALAFASHTAAITVSRMGAMPSLPTLAEVQTLLKERGYRGFDSAALDILK